MKPNQLLTKLAIPSSLVILTSLSITTNQAYAGGYDDPSLFTDENPQLVTVPAVLNWDKWEKPYVSGNNICRQKNGDVICLPKNVAQKLGVHIYSPKKAPNSQPRKDK